AYAYSNHSEPFIVLGIVILAGMIASAGLSGFFVGRTLILLSHNISSMSQRTRKMQQKLTTVLIVQVGTPLIIQIGPLGLHALSLLTNSFSPGFNNAGFCIQFCHASVHTILLILST
ncbi:hypothetical protein PFISCL1PPCAC_14509, partial [Pristionchus fissidentatus]